MSGISTHSGGPDFLCIGLQKAGTRTLHQILSLDARFWMPLVKEFHHFDNGQIAKRHERFFPLIKGLSSCGKKLAAVNQGRVKNGRRPLNDLDLQFLTKSQAYLANGCRDGDYLDLFSMKTPGKITGDITPGYSRLVSQEVEGVHKLLPNAKLVLIIRDPIARAWSMVNMHLRQHLKINRKMPLERAQDMMLEAITKPAGKKLIDNVVNNKPLNSFPSKIYETWAQIYGPENMRVFSLEELGQMPHAVVHELFGLVKGGNQINTGTRYALKTMLTSNPNIALKAAPNSKKNDPRILLDPTNRALFVDTFAEEIRRCQEIFGERAHGWAEKYEI